MICSCCNTLVTAYHDKSKQLCKKCYRKQTHVKIKEQITNCNYRVNNRNKILLDKKKYYNDNLIIEKEKRREYEKLRIKTDINFRIRKNLRVRVKNAIKRGNNKILMNIGVSLLYINIHQIYNHLESQLKLGMSWSNYGQWHIDHIRPLSSFDLSDLEQLKQACHYTNLQPLWAADNLKKGNRLL